MHVGAGIGRKSLAIGMETAASNPMAGVAKDATSHKFMPATAGQWTTTMVAAKLATGNPSYGWLCQEPSGNLASFLTTCTLTAANAPSYANAVPGWAAKAVGWTDGGTANFANTTTPPDGGASSLAMLCYQYVTGTTSGLRFMAAMTNQSIAIAMNVTVAEGLDNATAQGAEVITDGIVRPFFIVYNRAATTCKLYTGVDKIDCGYVSSTGVLTGIGATALTNPTGGCLYAVQFTGTAAELNDAQAKALLNTLGWTVAW